MTCAAYALVQLTETVGGPSSTCPAAARARRPQPPCQRPRRTLP